MAVRLSVTSRFSSIYRQAASTFCVCGLRSSGVQRWQGRYPCCCACVGESKNSTFSRFGRRLGHEGRQKTPVDFTAYTNRPSALASRASTRVHFWLRLPDVICICIYFLRNTTLWFAGECRLSAACAQNNFLAASPHLNKTKILAK